MILKAFRSLFALALIVAGWCAVVWWLIMPDFDQWRLAELAAIHAGPPVLLWGGWRFWLYRRRQGRAAAALKQEERAVEERQLALEAARQTHAVEQQRLQFGCDCRALSFAQLTSVNGLPELKIPENDAIHSSILPPDDLPVDESLLGHLRPGIEEALDAIYTRCPAAAAFPVYVVPPTDVVGEEVIAAVRQVHSAFVADTGNVFVPGSAMSETANAVLFLPQRDSAADSVIGLFEINPELPGGVVLAFDSPWWREQRDEGQGWDEENPMRDEQRQWRGAAAQGVFAVFLTNPRLAEMLARLPRSQPTHGLMTPYWEKNAPTGPSPAYLTHLTDAAQEALCASEPLARIHRAALVTIAGSSEHRLELAQHIETQIERAQIHSAQIEIAFDAAPDAVAPAQAPSSAQAPSPACGWLVHNAGGVGVAGHRLASLGCALFRRGLEVDPIEGATNVTAEAGDLGQACSVAMLAVTVAQAASAKGSALCAEFGEFGGNDRLSLFFATAPKGSA